MWEIRNPNMWENDSAERDSLKSERDSLVAERDSLKAERDSLKSGRDRIEAFLREVAFANKALKREIERLGCEKPTQGH